MLKTIIFTDKGARPINEDAAQCFQNNENACFVLCDGLGGHGMGDFASSLVVNIFGKQLSEATDMRQFLDQAFSAAQEKLMMEQRERHALQKMKTTAVALATDGKSAYIGHVGDSRLYVFRKNKIKLRTKDHSIPQMLVLSGEIKESEIRNHPDRNIVLRAMGIEWDEPKYELLPPIPLKKCDAFLLCSDGFWELIEDERMCELLKDADTPEKWLNDMVDEVRKNGVDRNMDNFSAIAIWNT